MTWQILIEHAPTGEWVSLRRIYTVVEEHAELDEADRAGVSDKSSSPKWKRTVRNLLQGKKTLGEVEWDGNARFRFHA